MTEITTAQLTDRLGAAADALAGKVAHLSDDDVRAATGLPGWTRGHVLAHVANVSDAVARQVEYALRGDSIEFYDGGTGGRNQAIEMAAGHPAAEHRATLDAALQRVLSALAGLDDEQWRLRINYRDGTVYDGALALWRELVIHLADLDVGRGPETWSKEFCLYLLSFLAARVPENLRLVLLPVALPTMTLGSGGDTISVQGMLTDIAAWLAGRTPTLDSLRAEAAADSVDLPQLLPWPTALAK
ncbi:MULTISPECIES: maleylpyruvate isomerase family mycothiol-dependent enzyme [unclassified Arthrobacter]|uniref:maleylpyruvate isomerase family mycothiol-dependent enzyme n=1 Tax=unclassified Arthrobacter TaxID=235627 RepID=UPI00159CFEC3|nr:MULTISPECIES: maleylpyruvate isomerase family mycothiol-dependent enzyme [unclassified Arthrobacter]MCQ9165654.1 maleylpyruvate isomerase family mycothiol-dependent enzyme [Arthrobacter sp. STN4]NVM99395.1 maleylpyruvate isomerase family mycothiol-dependent enzyme [Arthrobacter sp. SDTb3-6]